MHLNHFILADDWTNRNEAVTAPLLVSPDNSALCQVIGAHLKRDLIAGKNTDEILAKLSGNVRKNNCTILQLYTEHCIRKLFYNYAFQFNYICLGQ